METKIEQKSIKHVKVKMDFPNGFVVNPVGKKGGVVLLWHKDDEVDIFNLSNSHIHTKFHTLEASKSWVLTRFDGNPKTNKR